MREIKFRLPTKCQNSHFRWEYFVLDFPENGAVKREWGQKNCDCPTHGIDQGFSSIGTAQQYTGLKDKNGKEIYEGDVLRWKYKDDNGYRTQKGDKIIGAVWYNTGTTEYRVEKGNDDSRLNEFNTSEIEIIGNIYENPELISE